MKLDKSHIGKKIRRSSWEHDWKPFLLIDLGISHAWIEKDGFRDSIITDFSDWEIVEPPKKPNERIQEIYISLQNNHGCLPPCQICKHAERQSIISYLDEQAEKK